MKIWAKLLKEHRIQQDAVLAFGQARPSDIPGWTPVIRALCRQLDLSEPVMLHKHLNDLNRFGRTVFRPSDFMEPVAFDRLEIELFPEKDRGTRPAESTPYRFR